MRGMMMSEEMKVERTEIANGALDFLLARLESEIDELSERVETLFKNINEMEKRNSAPFQD
jgi:cell division protein FtsB